MTLARRTILSALGGLVVLHPSLASTPQPAEPIAPDAATSPPPGASSGAGSGARMADLSFRILRNDSQIGTHALTFTSAEGRLTVRVASDIRVGLGPITFYRYTHRAEERWLNGAFVSLDATTDDNGAVGRTTVRREAESIRVDGPKAPDYQAPADALPLTHWNRSMLKRPMISSQTGELLRPAVVRVGPAQLPTMMGAITADHYTMRGDPDLDTWYDSAETWAGLRLTARDGSIIRYERS